jgi:ferrous iron transport protein A
MIRNCKEAGYWRILSSFLTMPRVPPSMSNPTSSRRSLSRLRAGESAVVERIDADDSLSRRLLEIGFVPGAAVEVLATMWPHHDPLAVRVGGATFALRRQEADWVTVA